jgi:DNA-binding transcriptional MerR regulator
LTSRLIALIVAVEARFNAGVLVSDHHDVDIADLGRQTRTAPSALRYYERLGLLSPTGRSGGRRQYASSAAELVAMIRLYQDAGFTLAEIKKLLLVRAAGRKTAWARHAQQKIDELDHRIAEALQAKEMLEHALNCPAPNLLECPSFRDELQARLIDTSESTHRRAQQPMS